MEINCQIMDNDSGYISHQSNFDSSSDNVPILMKSPVKSFCLSEDTLLERPIIAENLQNPALSPDLFSDEDSINISIKTESPIKTPKDETVHSLDMKMLRQLQNKMIGVCPPPSLTFVQFTVEEMLEKIKLNPDLFCSTIHRECSSEKASSGDQLKLYTSWPEVLILRHHGLHHNRSKISEEYELLCGKYAERYIGAETQSSCTVFEMVLSPSKRKMAKPKWQAKSPGRRLSHLARRRITFTSANLQQTSSGGSSIVGSRARQILVDVKKLNLSKRKSPRKSPRKTPSKSPFKAKKSTPSSSAKKKARLRLFSSDVENIAPGTSNGQSSVKRTLFPCTQTNATNSTILSLEKKSTKRALFQSPPKSSPHKKSPFKCSLFDRKRKRNGSESDENNPPKLFRSVSSMSLDNMKTSSSLSFSSSGDSRVFMNRTLSEASFSSLNSTKTEDLSDVHKKKLQWAVYESLRLQNITPAHSQFKVFASVLARVTRRFLQSTSSSRAECRTSERMLRIARYHSYAVVKGKSVDEIVNEYLKSRAKLQKPQGYIGIEEYQANNSRENVLQDRSNIMEKSSNERPEKWKSVTNSRLDRIKKVISFEEMA